ncbi:MAG: glycosyltransferase [Bacteroidota bacterium]|nr:glycosyltransferase [Bacteroidota bacterium]
MAGWGPWAFVVAGVLAVLHAWTLRGWSRAWRKALTSGVGAEPRALDWTVVIPARNESQHLGNVLDDLAEQELQVNILVVDDHSTDGTASLAASHQLVQQGHLRVLTAEGIGKKSALLSGMASASTPWVVTLDADVRLGPSWAQGWQDRLSGVHAKTACVAGPVVLSLSPQSPSLWDGVQALDYAAQMGWSAGCLVRDVPGSASGANMAVRVDTYPDTRNLGASGDDTLVVQALQRGGHRVEWLSDSRATVRTAGANSFPAWIEQRMRWAGKAVHYDRRAKRTAWWMAWMSVTQWTLWLGACASSASGLWGLAWGWWALVTGMNMAYARPVARWFGLQTTWAQGAMLGLTQPAQVPLILMAQAGLLRPWGIASKPSWKGRTCDP